MTKLVSADTIKEITKDAAFFTVDIGPSPDVGALLENIQTELQEIVDKNRHYAPYHKRMKSGDKLSLKEKKVYDARRLLKQLNWAMDHLPRHSAIVPVLYTRISPEQNKDVHNEYSKYVKPKFMKFLAKEHTNDLRKMGICDHGIKRMATGLDPADKHGNLYDVSVDHIIERAGSGRLGMEKTLDPNMPEGARPTYGVNHFSNLTLVQNSIHADVKNVLNDTQRLYDQEAGESAWGIMVIPTRDAKNPRFVTEVDPDEKHHHVKMRELSPNHAISHLVYVIKQANQAIADFEERPVVQGAKTAIEKASGKTGAELSEELKRQETSNQRNPQKLSKIFNDILTYDEEAGDDYHNRIVPLFTEIVDSYYAALDKIGPRSNQKDHAQLRNVVESQGMQKLKTKASFVPVKNVGSGRTLLDTFARQTPASGEETVFEKAKKFVTGQKPNSGKSGSKKHQKRQQRSKRPGKNARARKRNGQNGSGFSGSPA